MRWYWIALIVSLVIGPFDALYVYIRAQKRREALKHKQEQPSHQSKKHMEDDP